MLVPLAPTDLCPARRRSGPPHLQVCCRDCSASLPTPGACLPWSVLQGKPDTLRLPGQTVALCENRCSAWLDYPGRCQDYSQSGPIPWVGPPWYKHPAPPDRLALPAPRIPQLALRCCALPDSLTRSQDLSGPSPSPDDRPLLTVPATTLESP